MTWRCDPSVICVVEEPKDVAAVIGEYRGRYHVLGGTSPSTASAGKNCGSRPTAAPCPYGTVTELILATDPNLEGEATATYCAADQAHGPARHPARRRRRRPAVRGRGDTRGVWKDGDCLSVRARRGPAGGSARSCRAHGRPAAGGSRHRAEPARGSDRERPALPRSCASEWRARRWPCPRHARLLSSEVDTACPICCAVRWPSLPRTRILLLPVRSLASSAATTMRNCSTVRGHTTGTPFRLSDDIAAVVADLIHGLKHYRADRKLEALWRRQNSYFNHWGTHALAPLCAPCTRWLRTPVWTWPRSARPCNGRSVRPNGPVTVRRSYRPSDPA